MRPSDFDYPLPKDLIAQRPLEQRDGSRMMVVDRKTGTIKDERFSDLVGHIPEGDVLVLNDTKVYPARLLGKKTQTGGKVDLLLLGPSSEPCVWRCLVQPSLKEGQDITLDAGPRLACVGRDRDGIPLVRFPADEDPMALARRAGSIPLPPYIKREPDGSDHDTYQTVFARNEGAVAAPTAGLHFTKELLKALQDKGVRIEYVTLHVGYGTFKPVEDPENHHMHSEWFELRPEVAERINAAKTSGKKVWAVGTTALRVLETCVQKKKLIPGSGETDLFIRDPFPFEAVDRLITNFHLPKTTLLLLVSAFMGEPLRKKAYDRALSERYRFYSYGDSMLIL